MLWVRRHFGSNAVRAHHAGAPRCRLQRVGGDRKDLRVWGWGRTTPRGCSSRAHASAGTSPGGASGAMRSAHVRKQIAAFGIDSDAHCSVLHPNDSVLHQNTSICVEIAASSCIKTATWVVRWGGIHIRSLEIIINKAQPYKL